MSSTGTRISRSSGLRRPVSTIVHSRPVPDEEAAHLLERPLRGRQADALERLAGRVVEALERERQVRAALGLRDGVDLVNDHPLGAGEDLARPRGEHQVERLGRGDQHVGRLAQHRLALALRRVAGTDRHPARRRRCPSAARAGCARCRRRAPSAGRRRPAACAALPPLGIGTRRSSPRGRPRASFRSPWGREEHVLARRNSGPGLLLSGCGALEGTGEPVTYLWGERFQRIAAHVTDQRIGVRVAV